jgi:hypothetical protein
MQQARETANPCLKKLRLEKERGLAKASRALKQQRDIEAAAAAAVEADRGRVTEARGEAIAGGVACAAARREPPPGCYRNEALEVAVGSRAEERPINFLNLKVLAKRGFIKLSTTQQTRIVSLLDNLRDTGGRS